MINKKGNRKASSENQMQKKSPSQKTGFSDLDGRRLKFLVLCAGLGAAVGILIWLFLFILGKGQYLLFEWIPEHAFQNGWVLIVCLVGGLCCGLYEKYLHGTPESLDQILATIKKTKSYPHDRFGIRFIGALLPLVFGASAGPEAGLAGLIAGACYFVGEKIRYAGVHLKELSSVGISTALGIIFGSPFFGLGYSLEDRSETLNLKKPAKVTGYLCSILAGFGTYSLCGNLFGGSMGFPRLEAPVITSQGRLFSIVLILIGILAALVFEGAESVCEKGFKWLKGKTGVVIPCILGGLLLGISGEFLPMTLFSGEEQIAEVAADWLAFTPFVLIATGIVKLLITNICIQSGLKGGHFFPVIFAGIAIGYGMAFLTGIDPVFCSGIITASLLGAVMKKPAAVILLMLLCFPLDMILWITAGAAAGTFASGFFNRSVE